MRMRRLAALSAVVAVLAVGCQGEEPETGKVATTATTQPEDPPTSEPDAGPVPVLEEVPGEAPEVTFVKHFYDLYWYARDTGDVEPYLELTHPDCAMCRESVAWFDEVYGDGGRIEGGPGEFLTDPHLYEETDPPTVVVAYQEPANEAFDANGELVEEVPPCASITETLELEEEDGGWVVRDMQHSLECDG